MFNYYLLSGSAEDTEKKKKYVIFGDSHSKFFMPRKFTVPKPTGLEVHIYRIGGASMAGFGKRESTLQVADKIREAIYNHQNLDLLILKFGQVDVELGYYYRLIVKKENINFLDFAEKIVSLYFDFLKSLACSKKHIHILGINLPSIFRKRNAIRYTNQVITQNIKDRTLVR